MINPNFFTIAGLFIALIAVFTPEVYALILFSIAFFFDVIDGYIARKYKKVTKWGGILDSIFDKLVEILFVFYISVLMHTEAIGILAAGCSIMVSYMKHRADVKVKSFLDRPKRMILLLIIFIVYLSVNDYAFEMMLAFVIINALALIKLLFNIHKKVISGERRSSINYNDEE